MKWFEPLYLASLPYKASVMTSEAVRKSRVV